MSLILSGSDGLSDIDGTAATPAIRGTDTNTGIFFPAADTIAFSEDGTEVARFDNAGNLGIGTSSPSNRLSVVTASGGDGFISVSSPTTETAGVLVNGGTSSNKGAIVRFQKNASTKWTMGTDSAIIGGTSDNFHLYGGGADSILFSTNAAERMRIDSGGRAVIGGTTGASYFNNAKLTVYGDGFAGKSDSGFVIGSETSGGTTFGALSLGSSFGAAGLGDFNLILQTNAGKRIYVQNRSAGVYLADGGTSWTSNSDERIKKNLVPIEDGLNKVCTLRSVIGEYIGDELERKRPFLIAQDVDAVLPEAVDKTKEDVWGVQYSDVIPLLVASIKELNAKVDAQAARIAALEAAV
jgi:hypothetical protein